MWKEGERGKKCSVIDGARMTHNINSYHFTHRNIPNALLQPLRPAFVEFYFIHCPHCTFYILYSHKTFVQAQVVSYCILTTRDIGFYKKYYTVTNRILSIMSVFQWWGKTVVFSPNQMQYSEKIKVFKYCMDSSRKQKGAVLFSLIICPFEVS